MGIRRVIAYIVVVIGVIVTLGYLWLPIIGIPIGIYLYYKSKELRYKHPFNGFLLGLFLHIFAVLLWFIDKEVLFSGMKRQIRKKQLKVGG